MIWRVQWSLWGVAALLSTGVAVFSYRYLPGWGPRSPEILGNVLARPWLFIHIAGAATALLVSPLQFIPAWRSRRIGVHRWLGRVYVVGCLVGAVGGFVNAFGSFAGPIATAGFATLALTWIWVNVEGWRTAVDRRFDLHRRWMIRSFALTFAAVSLRLYMALFPVLHVPFMESYRFVSWWSWVGNLLVAELYLLGLGIRASAAQPKSQTAGGLLAHMRPRAASVQSRERAASFGPEVYSDAPKPLVLSGEVSRPGAKRMAAAGATQSLSAHDVAQVRG